MSPSSFRAPGSRSPKVSLALAERKFIDVVSEVMGHRMSNDERIVCLGEDIHRLKGGTNGQRKDWRTGFWRVIGTPICEQSFAGLAGAAMDGHIRPVVEFMYLDFMLVAADQVFNQIGKVRHMFGNTLTMPSSFGARSPWGPVTAPSTPWTRRACTRSSQAGGSWRPPRLSIMWG